LRARHDDHAAPVHFLRKLLPELFFREVAGLELRKRQLHSADKVHVLLAPPHRDAPRQGGDRRPEFGGRPFAPEIPLQLFVEQVMDCHGASASYCTYDVKRAPKEV
jgi:hypothetical protein